MSKKRISIIYRDDSVVVCEKPAGMPVQSDKSRDIDLETSLKLDLIKGQNPEKEPGCLVFPECFWGSHKLGKTERNREVPGALCSSVVSAGDP